MKDFLLGCLAVFVTIISIIMLYQVIEYDKDPKGYEEKYLNKKNKKEKK